MKKIIALSLLLVIAFGLFSCALGEKAIVGTWTHQNNILGVVTETTYTFNADGTGKKSNVLDIGFTYSFEGGKLLITTTVLGIDSTEEYSVSFGANKLTLTNEKDTIELEKVN